MIKKLKKVWRHKDGKTLFENLASLSLLQVANYALPFITLPYLTHVIGAEKFGALAAANAIMVYLQTVVDYGFNFTSTRDIAVNRENVNVISKIFSTVMVTRIALMLAALAVLLILILFIPYFRSYYDILLLTFLTIPASISFPDWFFQGMEKMKYITILNVFSKLIFTFLTFTVVKQESDFILYPALIATGGFVSGSIALYIIFTKFKVRFIVPTISEIVDSMKGGFNIFVNQIMPNIYNSFSTLLLSYWAGNRLVGIFDAAKRLVLLADRGLLVLSRVFFPYISRNVKKHGDFAKVSLFISLIISAIFFFLSDLLVKHLFAPEFHQSALILRIMSLSPFFLCLMKVYGTNYLIIVKRDRELRNITIYSSIFGFFLALFMTYHFQHIGAAITLITMWAIRGIACYTFTLKVKKEASV